MKPAKTILLSCLFLGTTLTSNAWLKYGYVFCDANSSGAIDVGDLPVQSVLVVVTNTSGTFSNASWTSAGGAFLIALPNVPDTYVDFVLSGTLPAGTTATLPAFNAFTITNDVTITNNFLIENPNCAAPPPVLKTGHVYCDANTNGIIDSGDVPVQSVLVVVTNVSGTFSNASWTTAEGTFLVVLPNVADTYVDFVLNATLPGGTTAILPPANTFTVTNAGVITNNFLIRNPLCAVSFPPPFKVGHVYCDANTNGQIDSADVPVSGALVVVTNFSGTFSNAAYTDAKGFFSIQLPPVTDLYGDYLVASSLAAGSTIVIPGENQTFQFSIPTPYPSGIVTNNFLVQNLACVSVPLTNNGHCWLTGGGTIKGGNGNKGKPLHSFGGVVNPGCKPTAAGGGNWNDIDFGQNLHFKGLTIQVVDCGNVPGHNGSSSPKSPFSYIEFQGTGTLKGIAKNKVDYGTVQFFAHAEDLNEPGHKTDRLYLRVFDSVGNTLLLISADTANPLNIAPVTISTGNLQIHPCK